MAITSLRISGAALTAERARLDVISENIANVQTTRGPDGRPYTRREVVFETITDSVTPSGGVRVAAVAPSDEPLPKIYNPGHPDADRQGYVEMPNVNLVEEMVDLITATRAYEANVSMMEVTKAMINASLRLIG